MDRTVEITPGTPAHLHAVLTLLTAVSLPCEGVVGHFPHFLVAHEGGTLVGVVGLEYYGASALLRSLAVTPAARGQGLARALTLRALHAAREQGIAQIFLLTETAAEFFPQFGFRRIAREETDAAVQASVEFRLARCQSAICMRCTLAQP
jgi:N-acetylglutamate synthase-like GNAT family acetyltransferase